MPTLNLYKERKFSTIIGRNPKNNEPVELKIPLECTVEEVERFLELQVIRDKYEEEEVSENEFVRNKQLEKFFSIAFDQLEILFQHYQPEITSERLKKMFTQEEVLKMLGFYDKYRLIEREESKKKLKNQ